jgi:hypothetical protein
MTVVTSLPVMARFCTPTRQSCSWPRERRITWSASARDCSTTSRPAGGAHRLDLALAAGVSPEASAAIALRAHRLTEPDRRWSMAGALRRIIREAQQDRRPRPRLGRVKPNTRAVREAREALTQLADTLADPGPVSAHGVAHAWILLTDATGPLYNVRSNATLGRRGGSSRARVARLTAPSALISVRRRAAGKPRGRTRPPSPTGGALRSRRNR